MTMMKKMPTVLLVISAVLLFCTAARAEKLCFECHEKSQFRGNVVHGPVADGNCTQCHNPHVAKFAGLLSRNVFDLCLSCHDDMSDIMESTTVHKPVRQGKCLDCHNPHVSRSKGLIEEDRPGGSCLKCHDELDKKYMYNHQPFLKGQCASCHNPHQSERFQLLADAPDKLCAKCHSATAIKNIHSGFPEQPQNCLSCHNPHGSSRKALIRDVLHPPYEEGCAECHQNGNLDMNLCLQCHEEMKPKMFTIHNHLMNKSGNSCVECHSPHAGDKKGLLKNRQKQVCRKCHQDTFAGYEDTLYSHPETSSCNDCHNVHGSNELAMLKGNGNEVCAACHETQGKFTHPVGEGVIDPRTGLALSCVSCHYPHGTDYKANLKLSGTKALCIQCHRSY